MNEQKWPQTVWLVRHGQSAGNVARDAAESATLPLIDIATRDMDTPLSALGMEQAVALGHWFGEMSDAERPTVLLSSPYVRARETAQLILEAAGIAADRLALQADERLREKEFGVLDRLTKFGIEQKFPELGEQRRHVGKFYFRPPGGESWCDVLLRLRSVLDTIVREHRKERVLIVSHQVIVNCFRYLFERLDEEAILAIDRSADVPNCSVTSYEFDAARVAPMVAQAVCEARVIGLAETGSGSFKRAGARSLPDDSGAVLIGPGMEGDPQNCAFVAAVLERSRDAKVVLDAGAMDVVGALRRRVIEARSAVVNSIASSSSSLLLTPHAGELAHLSGSDKARILNDPETAVLDAARRWNAVVALKGAITFIGAPDGRLWRHEGGNVGLATSGSGDVLSGLITGFAARGATIEQASAWGVALHARAGNALAARVGMLGYLAREIAGEVPTIMQALACKPRRS